MSDIPPQARTFLNALIDKFNRGERDQSFAEWAAMMASFLLEFWDLLD